MLILGLFIVSAANAQDLDNATAYDAGQFSLNASQSDDYADSVSACSQDDELSSGSNVIYFDASAASNGDGSKANPYRYVDENTLSNYIGSGNSLTAYFANGTYDLNANFVLASPDIALIGEDSDNVLFNSILSDKYDFEIGRNSNVKLINITFNHINILNHGTLEAYDSNFYNSNAFTGQNAPLTYNYNSSYGGVINCDPIDDSCPYIYLENCLFSNNHAYCGGVISLKNSYLAVNNSRFQYSTGQRKGGVIYAMNSRVDVVDSTYYSNSAYYGGVIYCERSLIDFDNARCIFSEAYSFGGIIASKYSNINVDDSYFEIYYSMTDAAGAIYNFKGNLNIDRSTFYRGSSVFGGAICNLQSNLTILSSSFTNDTSGKGGVIYNIYGKMYIENNTFRNSSAYTGSAIYSELSDTAVIVNNTFINSPTRENTSVIYFDSSAGEIIQYGNHFEDEFYLCLIFSSYINGEEVLVKSNVLKCVVSNTGIYRQSYNQIDSASDSSRYCTLNIYCPDCPENSTVFCDYNSNINVNFNFTAHLSNYVDHVFRFRVTNFMGDVLDEIVFNLVYDSFFTFDVKYPNLSVKSHMFKSGDMRLVVEEAIVSSIESVYSDLDYIPSSYDSRDYGYVTPVKDQGEGGNCWAFAGIATIETCIKKITNITYDFSEENLKNMMSSFSTMGLDIEANNGGYDSMVMGYLTAWFGPILDIIEPYDELSSLSTAFYPSLHIQNIVFLPPRENGQYDYLYKRAIMDYGAVAVTFDWLNQGLHSVSLVGWDDNYVGMDSLGKISKGAWIFKNSWGSDWADNGFGYLSYSTQFASDVYDYWHAYSFIFNKTDDYNTNIHPDYSGVTDYICNDGPITCSIKVDGSSRDINEITAFATYFKVPTKYVVEISDPINHIPILHQEGYSNAGYYTIPLYKKVTIGPKESLMFSLTFNNDGDNYLPVCMAEELTKAHFQQYGNFFYNDGQKTVDMIYFEDYHEFLYSGTRSNTLQVPSIHLFTEYSKKKTVDLQISEFDSLNVNERITLNMTIENVWSDSNDFADIVQKINGTLITVTVDGKDYYALVNDGKASLTLSFDRPGSYRLYAQLESNKVKSDLEYFDFKVYGNAVISASSISKVYGGSEKSVVTLKDEAGNVISNAVVYYNVGGKTSQIKTDSQGRAVMDLSLAPKDYTATVSFAGSGNYKAATAKVKIVVKKASAKIVASKKTFKLKVKTKKYTVTIKDNFGKPIKNVKLTIKVKGKTYSAKTNAKGKATFKITKLRKKGTYTATVKFAGNAYYNAVKKTVKITVKK